MAAAVAIGTGVGACNAVRTGHEAPRPVHEGSGPTPFPEIVFSQAEQTSLRRAEDRLVEQCMRQKGVDYRTPQGWSPSAPENPYGLLSRPQAESRGYPLPTAGGPSPEAGQRLTGRQRSALLGTEKYQRNIPLPEGGELAVRTDGCFYSAQKELYGEDWKPLLHTFETLTGDVVNKVRNDERFKKAERQWATCMRTAQFPVTALGSVIPDAMDALERVRNDKKATARLNDELRSQAVHDADCQQQVRLPSLAEQAQHDAKKNVLGDKWHAELGQLHALRERALATARHLTPTAESHPGVSRPEGRVSAAGGRHHGVR
ncbi:hypothetical protein ACFP1Z_12710 [Streptomyces gamaensis]|uniref:Lipoprotein n=1 Tax=Streptomyces gamaensis TaxID=1763542 RepID=A0ABW0Z1Y6_9ACTN